MSCGLVWGIGGGDGGLRGVGDWRGGGVGGGVCMGV